MTPEGGPVRLAGRALDIPLRDRILFGSGRIADLPAAVVAERVRRVLEAAGIRDAVADPAINNSPPAARRGPGRGDPAVRRRLSGACGACGACW